MELEDITDCEEKTGCPQEKETGQETGETADYDPYSATREITGNCGEPISGSEDTSACRIIGTETCTACFLRFLVSGFAGISIQSGH